MRRAALLGLLCAACGGAPAGPVSLELRSVAGGRYLGVCVEGERIVATRAFRTEAWQLGAGAPPVLSARTDSRTPLEAPACAAGQPGPGEQITWRLTPGPIRDATFDGDAVWAVAEDGLWRWLPGPGEPLPVLLPRPIHGRSLVGIFRDGDLLWLRGADGRGWPIRVEGPNARQVAPEAELPPTDDTIRAPFGEGYVESRIGGRHLRVLDADSHVRVVLEIPPLEALMPWSAGVLLVAAGGGLRALRDVPGEGPHVDAELALGGPTVRLFVNGDTLLAVGERYGLAVLEVRPTAR